MLRVLWIPSGIRDPLISFRSISFSGGPSQTRSISCDASVSKARNCRLWENTYLCLIISNMDSVLNKEYNKYASLILLDISFILSDKKMNYINSIYNLNTYFSNSITYFSRIGLKVLLNHLSKLQKHQTYILFCVPEF